MKVHYLLLYKAFVIVCAHGLDLCPDGSYVLGRGLSPEDKKAATDEHNYFRQKMVDGEECGQPRAKYMKTMTYDDLLGAKCVPISNQCWMNHIEVTDDRWSCVGQNIYIEWHSQFNPSQNWTAALASWFYECNDFKYPNISVTGADVGHYTQVVWANSDTVGCDVISYIDRNKPWTPFCKMYTCNYGPCGNYNYLPPYDIADGSSCSHQQETEKSKSSSESSSESKSSDQSHSSSTTLKDKSPNDDKQQTPNGSKITAILQNIFQHISGKGKI